DKLVTGVQTCALPILTTVADYQSLVPLCDYESCSPDILRIAAGERNVLTSEPVRLFEPTSGSSGAQKWVPYNRALQREFQAGIQIGRASCRERVWMRV